MRIIPEPASRDDCLPVVRWIACGTPHARHGGRPPSKAGARVADAMIDRVSVIRRIFPFLDWFPLSAATLRADTVAGVTVALVLIPQSMAYAQLAGLPPYYGLYAAFLPVAVAALWGSSRQLATGPVAMVSLLTGATLSQFAAPGSGQFIAYAIALALMVGVMELAMGLLRLGAIVNFLSHPVIVGFTNAAALIIGLSQLDKLLGVHGTRTDSFVADTWTVLQQAGGAHLPTLAMGVGALALMLALRRYAPRLPAVLIAVTLATLASWAGGFERSGTAQLTDLADPEAKRLAVEYTADTVRLDALSRRIDDATQRLRTAERAPGLVHEALAIRHEVEVMRVEARHLEDENRLRMRALRAVVFVREPADAAGHARLVPVSASASAGTEQDRWRIRRISGNRIDIAAGGDVVGAIPPGIPVPRLPELTWETIALLLKTAFIITLVGFMEAISIAKAMATSTRQRIEPNRELVGQGLANIAAGLMQAFPVSGSFSRSAVNLDAGARTGFASVVTAALVLVTLLALTPLLYHLPQAVLAAVIMLAVVNLVNVGAMRHAWQAHRHDGIAAVVTFVATLAFAPHLDAGILIGGGLAIVLYLLRTMKPRVAILAHHPDGTLRDARLHGLPVRDDAVVVRFDGELYFANVPHFEDSVLAEVAAHPRARCLLVVGDGINAIDASGEEVIRHLVERLRENGMRVAFSGLKQQVLAVMRNTGLHEIIGERNLFRTADAALAALGENGSR